MSEYIDSLNHPLASYIRELLTREGRVAHQQIIIDDDENIIQALLAGVNISHLISSDLNTLSTDLKKLLPQTLSLVTLAKRTGKKLFGGDKFTRTFAIAKLPAIQMLNQNQPTKQDLILLDGLTISGNLGAIIRTSVAFNIGSIVVLNADPIDIFDRRTIRASRGFIFHIPIIACPINECLNFLNTHNIPLVITSLSSDVNINSICNITEPVAIALGSEKTGCSEQLLKASNHITVKIPINKKVESLNVSVAASIALYVRYQFNSGLS